MPDSERLITRDPQTLARLAAQMIAAAARAAIAQRQNFTLVLSGGTTPERAYALLGRTDVGTEVDWQRTMLFFGDERYVAASDPASNFGMARRTLIDRVGLPAANVFVMPTDAPSPAAGAKRYGEMIGSFFAVAPDSVPPQFDLVLLGLGDDGHTASLFPGQPALQVKDTWVTSSPPGRLPPPVERMTLTFPILNRARQVLFLVAGEKKAEVIRAILDGAPTVDEYPAAGIRPVDGKFTWLLDEDAARLLKR